MPTQDVHFSDSSDDCLTVNTLQATRNLRDTPICSDSAERRVPAEAIPTDRQSPDRPLSHSHSLNNSSSDGSNCSLNHIDAPVQHHHAFDSEQGPRLAVQSSGAMPAGDQGILGVSQALF